MKTFLMALSLLFCISVLPSAQGQQLIRGPRSFTPVKTNTQIQGEVKISKSLLKGQRVNDAVMMNYLRNSLKLHHTNLGARPVGLAPANYYGNAIPSSVSVKAAHTPYHYVYQYQIKGRISLPLWKPLMVKLKNNNVPYPIMLEVVAHPLIATLTPNDRVFGDYNFNGKALPKLH